MERRDDGRRARQPIPPVRKRDGTRPIERFVAKSYDFAGDWSRTYPSTLRRPSPAMPATSPPPPRPPDRPGNADAPFLPRSVEQAEGASRRSLTFLGGRCRIPLVDVHLEVATRESTRRLLALRATYAVFSSPVVVAGCLRDGCVMHVRDTSPSYRHPRVGLSPRGSRRGWCVPVVPGGAARRPGVLDRRRRSL